MWQSTGKRACLALCFRSCSSSEAPGPPGLGKRPEAYARIARIAAILLAKRCLFWPLRSLQLEVARASEPGKHLRFKNKLFSLNATIVELCLEMFDWAKYRAILFDWTSGCVGFPSIVPTRYIPDGGPLARVANLPSQLCDPRFSENDRRQPLIGIESGHKRKPRRRLDF